MSYITRTEYDQDLARLKNSIEDTRVLVETQRQQDNLTIADQTGRKFDHITTVLASLSQRISTVDVI